MLNQGTCAYVPPCSEKWTLNHKMSPLYLLASPTHDCKHGALTEMPQILTAVQHASAGLCELLPILLTTKAALPKSGRTGHCKPSWYSWATLPHCCQPLVPSSWIMLSPLLTPSALPLFWIAGKFFPLLATSNIRAVSSIARATRHWLIISLHFRTVFFLQCSCKAVGVKDSQGQGNGGILIPIAQFSP